jgi:PiT family inorganic phosphate transporter
LSPFLAVAATCLLYPLLKSLRASLGITRETCVCLGEAAPELVLASASCFQATASLAPGVAVSPLITVGKAPACLERYQGHVMGLSAQRAVDATHYLSAGAVCFARAVNDTPKIAALLLVAGTGFQSLELGLVACAMAVGGFLGSRRVART